MRTGTQPTVPPPVARTLNQRWKIPPPQHLITRQIKWAKVAGLCGSTATGLASLMFINDTVGHNIFGVLSYQLGAIGIAVSGWWFTWAMALKE